MALIAVERMKLTSTRAPWWSFAAAAIATPALAAAVAASVGTEASLINVVGGWPLSLTIVMAMGALAVTSEYAYGTIRTTFLATPRRSTVFWAKAAVIASVSALVGLISALGSWGVARLIRPSADIGLSTLTDWRQVVGLVPVFAISGVIAVAAAVLIRRTAGAVAIAVLWPTAVEPLFSLLPGVGESIGQWLPFTAARRFLTLGDVVESGPGPWLSLLVFAGTGLVLLIVAIAVANRRDA